MPGSPASFFCRASLQRSPKLTIVHLFILTPISFPNFYYTFSVDPPSPVSFPVRFLSSTTHHLRFYFSLLDLFFTSLRFEFLLSSLTLHVFVPLLLIILQVSRLPISSELNFCVLRDFFLDWTSCLSAFDLLICWIWWLFVFSKALSLWMCLVKLRGFNSVPF